MPVLLALAAAAAWGASDFVAGITGRRTPAVAVALYSQAVGAGLLLVFAPSLSGEPVTRDLLWGIAAGTAASSGLALLYHGLAVGTMSVVAPLAAMGAACVPVTFGIVIGERPPAVALAGVVLGLGAIAIISAFPAGAAPEQDPAPEHRRRRLRQPGVAAALGSGLAFGCFFIFLSRSSETAGLWPLVGARVSAVTLLAVVAATTGSLTRSPVRQEATGLLLVGLLDVAANVLYLVATRQGLLSLVAAVGSLYPAATVVLARIVLGEHLGKLQAGGLACALGAVVLIASA